MKSLGTGLVVALLIAVAPVPAAADGRHGRQTRFNGHHGGQHFHGGHRFNHGFNSFPVFWGWPAESSSQVVVVVAPPAYAPQPYYAPQQYYAPPPPAYAPPSS